MVWQQNQVRQTLWPNWRAKSGLFGLKPPCLQVEIQLDFEQQDPPTPWNRGIDFAVRVEPTRLTMKMLLILPWLMGTKCFACLFVTAIHSLKNQHPQLPHTSGRDGWTYICCPHFSEGYENCHSGRAAWKSKTSSSPWKFSLLFYVLLAVSVVWPLHDEKGWAGDMTFQKDFRDREYSGPSLMPAGSGSWRHQGSSGGHTVLALATPSQSNSTQLNFYNYKMRIMTLILLLKDFRSSAGEKQHTRASLWHPGELNANSGPALDSPPQFPCLWKQDSSTHLALQRWGWIIDWQGRATTLNQSHPGVM